MSKDYCEPQSTLMIRNLADDSRTEELRNIFKEFGRLKDVYIPFDYGKFKQHDFAFIQFEDPRDAKDARNELHGSYYLKREMRIDFARGHRKKPREMISQISRRCGKDDILRNPNYLLDMYIQNLEIRREISRSRRDMYHQNLEIRRERSRSRRRNRARSRSASRSDVRGNRGNYENPRSVSRSPVRGNFRRVGNDPDDFCRNPGPSYTELRARRDKWNRPVYRD